MPKLTPKKVNYWANAKTAYLRDGNLDKLSISKAHQNQLIAECTNDMTQGIAEQ